MYLYLYDSRLKEKQYQTKLKNIENRLTDIGITGKIARLTAFNDAKTIIAEEARRGAKTVVIVGGDLTLANVLAVAAGQPVVFGFIPVEQSVFGALLGTGIGPEACGVLSARKIEQLDIGWMNGRYFLGSVDISPGAIVIDYDKKFYVGSEKARLGLTITNLHPYAGATESPVAGVNPQDGKLEAFVTPVQRKGFFGLKTVREPASVFPFREMTVSSRDPFLVTADSRESKEIRLHVKLADEKLKMVVGRGRRF